jgi:HSP20 family protein
VHKENHMNTLIRTFEAPSVNRLFNQLFQEPFFPEARNGAAEPPMALDVSETEKELIVRASLPGYGRDDVEVEVHEGVLSIKAERTEQAEASGETWLRRERRTGAVTRRIALPESVADADPRAELKDGVLTLWLPKAEKALPKKVKIG